MPARYKYILVALHCLVFFFLFSSNVYSSDVVINEFLPDLPSEIDETVEEWVELYNNSDNFINLNGWVLKDAYDSHCLVIENQTINPKGFVVIKRNKSTFSLNNTNDDVRLFTSTASATPIDSFSYPDVYKNTSWGRIPDGSGEFTNKLIPSPGSPNQAPTPEPTPTPETSSTNTPSSTDSDQNNHDQSQELSDQDNNDQEDQNTEEYRGVVAGYKTTTQKSNQENVADLEISPIFEATNSASMSALETTEGEMATQSSVLRKKVNIPIVAGLGLIATGIVATLLKKYNINLVLKKKLWKKPKS